MIQYHAILYDTPYDIMQYHMIQYNYMQKYEIPYDEIQFHTVPYDAMSYNDIICIFGCKNSNFWQSGPYNGLPRCRMGTYLKTKGIQSYLKIWGCYDPIELGPSETKKRRVI